MRTCFACHSRVSSITAHLRENPGCTDEIEWQFLRNMEEEVGGPEYLDEAEFCANPVAEKARLRGQKVSA